MAVISRGRQAALEGVDRRPRSSFLRRDLQGLRGVAVLIGLSYHAGLRVPGGFVALDMFFVVSGFVICSMLLREHARSGTIDFRAFYVRRFWRLVPALALMVLVTLVASILVLSPVGQQFVAIETGVGAMLLHANLVLPRITGDYFSPAAELNPFLHTWSLSLEEQVYIVFPMLLFLGFLAARRSRRRIVVVLPLLLAFAVSLGVTLTTQTGHPLVPLPNIAVGYYGPVTRLWEFVAGGLLAVLLARGSTVGESFKPVLGWLGAATLTVALITYSNEVVYPGPATVAPVLALCALIWAGTSRNPARWTPCRFLEGRTIVFIGDMSYSWYLWHWPMIGLARAAGADPATVVVVALLSFFPAYASYRFLELPIVERRFPRPFDSANVQWRRARLVVVAPLAVAALSIVPVSAGYWSPEVQALSMGDRPHVGQAGYCYTRTAQDPCVLQPGPDDNALVLWGDSNAEQYSEPMRQIAQRDGRRLDLFVHGSCPPLDLVATRSAETLPNGVSPEAALADCRGYYDSVVAALVDKPPSTIVLGFGSIYARDDGVSIAPVGTRPAGGDGAVVFEAGLSSTIATLQRAGHRVVVAQSIPAFLEGSHWEADTCSLITIWRGRCSVTEPLAASLAPIAEQRRIIADVSRSLGAELFDPVPVLCSETCTTEVDGIVAFRDEGHLSIDGALLTTSALSAAIG